MSLYQDGSCDVTTPHHCRLCHYDLRFDTGALNHSGASISAATPQYFTEHRQSHSPFPLPLSVFKGSDPVVNQLKDPKRINS